MTINNRLLMCAAAVLLVCNGVQAAITAPDSVEAGRLAVCRSTAPATWAVYPQTYCNSYYVADNGCTCVFASPVKGVVTLMAATVNADGGVDITEHALYNGEAAPDDSDSTDKRNPDTIEGVIMAADVKATAADITALANAFTIVTQSIDNGAITTPAGARETFRAVWLREAAKTNPEAIDALSGLIDKISGKVDNTSLTTIKRDYLAAADALTKKADKLKAAQAQAQPVTRSAAPLRVNGGCTNGQCYRGWGW